MECTIEEQNDPSLYLEPIRKASCEFKSAVPVFLDFIETLNSTGSPEQLQILSKLVLKHLRIAEEYLITGKKQMGRVVCWYITKRKELEDDIKRKDKDLEEKRRHMERIQKELKEKKAKVDEAHRRYQAEQYKYIAQLRKSENTKVGCVLASTVCAGVGAFLTIASGGLAVPLAVGCQSVIATGSIVVIHETGKERDSAKYYWDRSRYELNEHQEERKKCQKQLKDLQTEYNTCVMEKTTVDENYDKVLKQLKDTAQFFESVLKCRHFISIAHGKTEILQETRKDFQFQNHLRLPLVEISEHLTSTFALELLNDSGMQQLCSNLKIKVAILPKAMSEDQNDDIDDYI